MSTKEKQETEAVVGPPVTDRYTLKDAIGLSGRIAPHVSLRDVVMTEGAFWYEAKEKLDESVHIATGARLLERGESEFILGIHFEFRAHEPSQNRPVRVLGRYQLTYAVDDEKVESNDQLSCFGASNGVLNAWPFWREFVLNSLTRLGLPTFTLPSLNLLQAGVLSGFKAPEATERQESEGT